MPRARRFSSEQVVEFALPMFWRGGFEATSMDELVRRTGVSRYALYSAYPDKRALLLAILGRYRQDIVDPAFDRVERTGSGLAEIAGYFEIQIAGAEAAGLPGPGCLIGNLAASEATRDPEMATAVQAHLDRLRAGFATALAGAGATVEQAEQWAALLVVTAQGLWSVSRSTTDAAMLRRPVAALIDLIRRSLSDA